MADEIKGSAGPETPVGPENLSMDQFSDLLSANIDQPEVESAVESEEEETETEEVEETTEEAEESEEEANEEEDPESPVDFDTLTPEQWEAVAKQLGSKAARRIAKLTREKREAQEERDRALSQKPEALELKSTRKVENPRIAAAKTIEDLNKELEQAEDVEEWAQSLLDANGSADKDEVIFEEGEKQFTKEHVLAIRNGARKTQKKDIPARLEELQQAEHLKVVTERNDAAALSMIPELSDEKSPVKATYDALMNDPVLKKAIERTPELRAVAGLAMAHAARSVTSLQASGKTKATPAKGTVPKPKVPDAPSSAGSAPGRPGAAKVKEKEALRTKMEKTGHPDDFAAYIAANL